MNIIFNGMCISGNMSGVQGYGLNLMLQGCRNHQDFNIVIPALSRNLVPVDEMQGEMTCVNNVNRLGRIFYEHTAIKKILEQHPNPILHCPAYILPINVKSSSVVTIHDTVALDYPQFCKNSNAAYFNLLLKRSICNATRIIAVSHSVKNDILRHCDVPADKISVVYHGIDDIYHNSVQTSSVKPSGLFLPAKYILFVGNVEPKKNLERLIEAYALLLSRKEDNGHKLIIAGQLGWKFKRVKDLIRKYRLQDYVIFLGYVGKDILPYLYSNAALFVFPSLCEGFGIPPLEAMACGTPVLFSSVETIREVTSDIGFMVNPYSVDDIARGIRDGLNDSISREDYIRRGLEYVQGFTWNKCWNETVKVYESIL